MPSANTSEIVPPPAMTCWAVSTVPVSLTITPVPRDPFEVVISTTEGATLPYRSGTANGVADAAGVGVADGSDGGGRARSQAEREGRDDGDGDHQHRSGRQHPPPAARARSTDGLVAGRLRHLGRRGLSGGHGRRAALHRIGAGRAEPSQPVWPGGVHPHSLGILDGSGLCVACGFGLRTQPVTRERASPGPPDIVPRCASVTSVPSRSRSPASRQPTRGARLNAVLATLLLHLNRRVSTDLLLDAVWGESVTESSHSTLETHIWRLRRLLEPGRGRGQAANVLVNDAGGYRLLAQPDEVDSARFEQLGLEVLDLGTTQQPERALQAADQALTLWRGAPFEPVAERPWAVGPIARLNEIRAQLQERRINAILGVGRPELAVGSWSRCWPISRTESGCGGSGCWRCIAPAGARTPWPPSAPPDAP